MTSRITYIVATMLAFSSLTSWAREIYRTTFDEFASGPNQLAGQNGWRATGGSDGAQGIDENILPGLGKSGFIGFGRPASGFVSVFRSITEELSGFDSQVVEFNTLLGIEDSTNGARDNFYIAVYNADNHLLGAVNFDNTQANLGIWRFDGASAVATGASFVSGNVHELYMKMDLINNSWSASLDGLPLFSDAPLNATGQRLQLGSFAAEWEIADPGNPGNNWMLFDEWSINVPDAALLVNPDPDPDPNPTPDPDPSPDPDPAPDPDPSPGSDEALSIRRRELTKSLDLSKPSKNSDRAFQLEWVTKPNFVYQIEWSENLSDWFVDMPVIEGDQQAHATFTDSMVKARRYYRLVAIRRDQLDQASRNPGNREPDLVRP